MKRQKVIRCLPLIAADTGALYLLAHTHSVWSFLFLTGVMIIAVNSTAGWYSADDEQPLLDPSPPSGANF
jgi:hypothetical protein